MMRASILLATALAVSPAVALADAVGPLPTSCPEGSAPFACHGPSTCRAESCTGDADCDTGEVCVSRTYCAVSRCCRSGWMGGCSDASQLIIHIGGTCSSGGTCSGFGEACRGVMVCVPGMRDAGPPPPPDAGTDAGVTEEEDAGAGDDDAGATDEDAGVVDEDAGAPMDGGPGTDAGAARDGGGGAMDAGPGLDGGRVDAGGGGPTDGGCCSVTGPRRGLAGELFALALGVALVRRLRRGRGA